MDDGRRDGACRILVILATGDAAGFRLCDGDDGGLDFVGCFGDGAEGLDFCYGCSLRGDLRFFVSWLQHTRSCKKARTVRVLDFVNCEVTVLMLVAKSVTTFVAVELTMGIVVAGIVIVGVNLVCVSFDVYQKGGGLPTVDVAGSPTMRLKSL